MESSIFNQDCECGERMLLCWYDSTFTCKECGLVRSAHIMSLSMYNSDNTGYKIKRIKSYSRLKQFEHVLRRNARVTPLIIHVLRCRFIRIHTFYIKSSLSDGRKNFLKYGFLIYKMLCLLGRGDLASFFTLPKTKKTLDKYESIWEVICDHFKWFYQKSRLGDKIYCFFMPPGGIYIQGLRIIYPYKDFT